MLLKRLELQGFKSFADKVSLDLTHGVTAVVGPNGSGKSNITDAIRWLLGEREARNLRGSKAEDLIFAGTKERPRLGLAQATLYFDNSSNFFPVDYKEISISRKISRDGESRIFLNKSEVRLKDIIDFFAKSRMGARGLTIVSQGESDVFINATPAERREMVEEILGLKEYQIKKAEANRRLKNTAFNLDKAKALIEELSPHLRMLKRQVSKYEGREEIAAELLELENRYYGNRLRTLNASLFQVEPALKEVEYAVKEEEVVIKELEAGLERVKNSEPEANEKIKNSQKKRNELLDKRFALQKDLSKVEARLELATDRESLKEANILDAVNEIKGVANASLKEGEVGKLKAALARIVSIIDSLFKQEPTSLQEFHKNKERLTGEIVKLDKELKDVGVEEAEFTKNIKDFNEDFKKAFVAYEEGRNKLLKLKEKKQNFLFERERAETRIKDLTREITEAGRRIGDFENWKGEASNDDGEITKKMFRLRGELASIGEIDPNIVKECKETDARHSFLTNQVEDLEQAIGDLKNLIKELDYKIHHEFVSAISRINEEFTKYIHLLFGGGKGRLIVESEKESDEKEEGEGNGNGQNDNNNEKIEAGVYVDVGLPRKKIKGLEVLSGGERALVSVAALFALISVSPPPFLVLDEIDAALDERNARRFSELLREFMKKTQFIIVTHNRATMEVADVLYGVTMSPDGTSKILSLKLT